MSSRLVAGVPIPDRVGGHPALDFCNTRAGWGEPTPKEYLTGIPALVLWTREAGLLTGPVAAELLAGWPAVLPAGSPAGLTAELLAGLPGESPATSAAGSRADSPAGDGVAAHGLRVLRRALRLRDAVHDAALGLGSGADWALISREAAAARTTLVLTPPGGGDPAGDDPAGGPAARWQPRPAGDLGPGGPEPALAVIALAAEDLLTSALVGCVAACPGTGCGWLFADPRRRRRWCSMAVCGNRAKARRHARRLAIPDHGGGRPA